MRDIKGGKPGDTSQFDTERWDSGQTPNPSKPDGPREPSVG